MMRLWLAASVLLSFLMSEAAWAVETVGASEMQCADQVFYPPEAVMYQIEGKTVLEFSRGPDGSFLDVEVKRSSGWAMLDEAALELIAGCRTTISLEKWPLEKRLTIVYDWSLDASPKFHVLVPGSCAASDRFSGFRAFDTRPSGADGILVRTLIRSNGQPYFTKAERGDVPTDVAARAVEYLRTCRFAPPGKVDSDKVIFGRVLLIQGLPPAPAAQ